MRINPWRWICSRGGGPTKSSLVRDVHSPNNERMRIARPTIRCHDPVAADQDVDAGRSTDYAVGLGLFFPLPIFLFHTPSFRGEPKTVG
jgi:hypothetical protein